MTLKEIVKKVEQHYQAASQPCAFYACSVGNLAIVTIGITYDLERAKKMLLHFCQKRGFVVCKYDYNERSFEVYEFPNRLI